MTKNKNLSQNYSRSPRRAQNSQIYKNFDHHMDSLLGLSEQKTNPSQTELLYKFEGISTEPNFSDEFERKGKLKHHLF